VPDARSRRRAEAGALGICEPLLQILSQDRWLVMQWRPSRGVLTRLLAASLWNSVVVTALKASDLHTLDPFAADRDLFLQDCARYRDRIILLPMAPEQALEELRLFGLLPHIVATTPRTARDVWRDLELASAGAPQAIVVGSGWRDATIADAVRDFVRYEVVELEASDDAWCVSRDIDQWLEWRS
jgi:hypothetical protein